MAADPLFSEHDGVLQVNITLTVPDGVSFADLQLTTNEEGTSATFQFPVFLRVWLYSGYTKEQMDSTPKRILMQVIAGWYVYERDWLDKPVDENAERLVRAGMGIANPTADPSRLLH